jgi:uroporphyrin-III C-methyltransferase
MTHEPSAACVTLVGAGPGDPELLTLKAVQALATASVILVDDLVHPDVLKHAHPHARIIHVGKRGGCQSTPQAFIEKLMAQEALAGESVVRLKGGDPLLFGRAGEEIAYLQSKGVGVRVVNGVTAGLAAASTLGLSLTHRAFSHGTVFVTGHASSTQSKVTPIDWEMLGRTAQACHLTLVIYMGINSAHEVQTALLKSMPGTTPMAVVQNASMPHQQSFIGQLSTMHVLMDSYAVASPAIILIGDVLEALESLHSDNTEDNQGFLDWISAWKQNASTT